MIGTCFDLKARVVLIPADIDRIRGARRHYLPPTSIANR